MNKEKNINKLFETLASLPDENKESFLSGYFFVVFQDKNKEEILRGILEKAETDPELKKIIKKTAENCLKKELKEFKEKIEIYIKEIPA